MADLTQYFTLEQMIELDAYLIEEERKMELLNDDDIYNDEYNGGYQPIYRTDKQAQVARDNKGKRKADYAKLREQKRSYE